MEVGYFAFVVGGGQEVAFLPLGVFLGIVFRLGQPLLAGISQIIPQHSSQVGFMGQAEYGSFWGLRCDVALQASRQFRLLTSAISIDDITISENGNGETFVAANSGGLDSPKFMTIGPDDNLYVTSTGTDSVLRYNGTTGEFIDEFVETSSGGLDNPVGLAFGPDGNLYVASTLTDNILRFDGTSGNFLDEYVESGAGGLDLPRGIVFDDSGNLYIANDAKDNVLVYNGTSVTQFVTTGGGGLDRPMGMSFGPDGDLYVASLDSGEVLRFSGTTVDPDPSGAFISADTGGLGDPIRVTFGPDGALYVSDRLQVMRFDATTDAFVDVLVPTSNARVDMPKDLQFGPDGSFFIMSANTDEILRYGQGFAVSLSQTSDTVAFFQILSDDIGYEYSVRTYPAVCPGFA